MRNASDRIMDMMINSLSGSGLSEEQMEMVENYLDGSDKKLRLSMKKIKVLGANDGTGPSVLAADQQEKSIEKCLDHLEKHKDNEHMKRYLDVLIEIYGGTIYPVLTWKNNAKEMLTKPQKIAIMAQNSGNIRYTFDSRQYSRIRAISKDNEDMKQALEYTDPDSCNADLMIYTAMFYEGDEKKIWNGLVPVTKKYPEQFKNYQHLIARNSYVVFLANLSDEQISMIRDYVSSGNEKEIPNAIISIIKQVHLKNLTANFLIGCATPNYRLSKILYRFLKLCLVIDDCKTALELMWKTECKKNMDEKIIRWYEDFHPDDDRFIEWAGDHEFKGVLAYMAKKLPEKYIQVARGADLELYRKLVSPLKSSLPAAFYKKYFDEAFDSNQTNVQAKTINEIITADDPSAKIAAQDYLNGDQTIDSLYPLVDKYSRTVVIQPVLSYMEVYGEDDFYIRCITFIGMIAGFCGRSYNIRRLYSSDWSSINNSAFEHFYDNMKKGGLNVKYRIRTVSELLSNEYEWTKDKMIEPIMRIFSRELKEDRDGAVNAFSEAPVDGRILGIRSMGEHAYQYKEELLTYMGDSSKQVKEELVKVLAAHQKMADDVTAILTSSTKAGEREAAAMVIGRYKNVSEYTEVLNEALEKEKSKKVADIIRKALIAGGALGEESDSAGVLGQGNAGKAVTVDEYIKECHKGGKRRSLEWLYKEPMPEVHVADDIESKTADTSEVADTRKAADALETAEISETTNVSDATDSSKAEDTLDTSAAKIVSEEYMQAVLLSYSGMSTPGVNKEVHILTDRLKKDELNAFMDVVFERWLAAGAEAKKKWVLYAVSIHGGSRIVDKLKHQIDEWAGASRGAIAADAVKALSLNDSPMALVTVDSIARKYKYKQVKKAAGDALQFAASELNLTVEELADRIVPDLGFDENMERHFDYGSRTFTVRISPALEIEVTDENGKTRKALPAVGKSDDPVKAERALAEFKELKKQMKATVKNQALRLELALSIDRKWTVERFEKLFVKNPIMHQFAISLIWGYYEKDKLVNTFRYMEDGTFNTVDEDEYELTGDGKIGLMHPIEMDRAEVEKWKEQLSVYEITQSIEQLDRPVYAVEDDEKGKKHLERFGGMILNGLSLSGKLVGLGWSKGVPMDGGVYEDFYRKDPDAGMAVELRFSGAYIGDENEDVVVYSASFYNMDDMDDRGYRYDMKEDNKAIDLDKVSKRYFSEIIYQLTKATKSSTDTDPIWKKEAGY